MKRVQRPLQYLSISVAFLRGDELADLEYEHKGATIIIIQMLAEIAMTEGFYMIWNLKTVNRIARITRQTAEMVRLIRKLCVDRAIFDETLFTTYKVISSLVIQDNFERVVRNNRKLELKSQEVAYILEDSKLKEFMLTSKTSIFSEGKILSSLKEKENFLKPSFKDIKPSFKDIKPSFKQRNSNSNSNSIYKESISVFSEKIKNEIIDRTGNNEIAQPTQFFQIMKFCYFITELTEKEQEDWFLRVEAFFLLRSSKYYSSLSKMLGDSEKGYADSIFKTENWSHKVKSEKQKKQKAKKVKVSNVSEAERQFQNRVDEKMQG